MFQAVLSCILFSFCFSPFLFCLCFQETCCSGWSKTLELIQIFCLSLWSCGTTDMLHQPWFWDVFLGILPSTDVCSICSKFQTIGNCLQMTYRPLNLSCYRVLWGVSLPFLFLLQLSSLLLKTNQITLNQENNEHGGCTGVTWRPNWENVQEVGLCKF